MATVFWICAVVGGTVLLVQFVLTLVGLGADALDLDTPEDLGDADADLDADVDLDGDVDTSSTGHAHLDSSWLFRAISFRTVIAALAFFGVVGLMSMSSGHSTGTTLLLAGAAGVGAMYGVYALMRALAQLTSTGNLRIGGAVGAEGTVYTPIPAAHAGRGKVQLSLQDRTVEYLAVTPGPALPTGTSVHVTAVVAPDTLEVEAEQ